VTGSERQSSVVGEPLSFSRCQSHSHSHCHTKVTQCVTGAMPVQNFLVTTIESPTLFSQAEPQVVHSLVLEILNHYRYFETIFFKKQLMVLKVESVSLTHDEAAEASPPCNLLLVATRIVYLCPHLAGGTTLNCCSRLFPDSEGFYCSFNAACMVRSSIGIARYSYEVILFAVSCHLFLLHNRKRLGPQRSTSC